MATVYINVPTDPGGPTAGGGGFSEKVFMLLRLFEWVFRPLHMLEEKKRMKQARAEFVSKNVRQGKNPDGSYSRGFPGYMTLRMALLDLGLDVHGVEKHRRGGVVNDLGARQLQYLTEIQIQAAIMECYVVNW